MRIRDWSSDVCSSDLGAEAVLKLVEKARVEIDALFAGAVERPHRRLRRAAARLAVARVEDELGHLETLTGAGEDRFPRIVRRAERVARRAARRVGRTGLLRGRTATAAARCRDPGGRRADRKSTRLNSSHQ